MKTFSLIVKIMTALAAIAGVVYVVATYGDKIVAWAKKMLGCPACEETEEAPAVEEEVAQEEAPVVEEAVEEVVEEVVEEAPAAQEEAPVADEADFEG